MGIRQTAAKGARAVLNGAGIEMTILRNATRRFGGVEFTWGEADAGYVRGGVREFVQDGKPVRFFIASETDEIQRVQRQGSFYEPEELAIISAHYTGGVFLDVGANVGNHAIYAALFLGAPRVIAIEPNPPAARILNYNLMLNGLTDRITHIPVGFGRESARAEARTIDHNLGATEMVVSADGAIQIVPGDEVITEDVSFIKIDTEGFELDVIAGLSRTIERCRPVMFIEVGPGNEPGFLSAMDQIGYRITEKFERYAEFANYLVEPQPG